MIWQAAQHTNVQCTCPSWLHQGPMKSEWPACTLERCILCLLYYIAALTWMGRFQYRTLPTIFTPCGSNPYSYQWIQGLIDRRRRERACNYVIHQNSNRVYIYYLPQTGYTCMSPSGGTSTWMRTRLRRIPAWPVHAGSIDLGSSSATAVTNIPQLNLVNIEPRGCIGHS